MFFGMWSEICAYGGFTFFPWDRISVVKFSYVCKNKQVLLRRAQKIAAPILPNAKMADPPKKPDSEKSSVWKLFKRKADWIGHGGGSYRSHLGNLWRVLFRSASKPLWSLPQGQDSGPGLPCFTAEKENSPWDSGGMKGIDRRYASHLKRVLSIDFSRLPQKEFIALIKRGQDLRREWTRGKRKKKQ